MSSAGYRKKIAPYSRALNLLKAGSVVKHCDNRSKNDCFPVQITQKGQRFCCVSVLQAGESAEGTAPSAARRTRREPLDSPGSHCFDRERPACEPMYEQTGVSPLHPVKPGECSRLMNAQALVFPHSPPDYNPVDIFRNRLELRAPKETVVPDPSSYAWRCQPGEIAQRQLTTKWGMPSPHHLTQGDHGTEFPQFR